MGKENDLGGRVAIVTGAAGGIGTALVDDLLASGARVCGVDVSDERLQFVRPDASAERLLRLCADVSDAQVCRGVVDRTRAHFGSVDVLVNNAAVGMGVVRDDHMTNLVTVDELGPEVWDQFIKVNLSGAFYLIHAAMPHFLAQGYGRIINITTSFFTMLRAGFVPYGPAKAGLEALSTALAKECKGTGVTVNIVVPGGPTDTPMVPASAGFDRTKLISPEMMAYPVTWLCTEEAGEVTDQRFIAADWDPSLPPAAAAARCSSPAAWPGLASNPVWPGGKPKD